MGLHWKTRHLLVPEGCLSRLVVILAMSSENIFVWNVQGLNALAHRNVVCDLVVSEHPSLIYLQETKMHVISDYDIMQILGSICDYVYLPAALTRGGIFGHMVS
jgi:hypothetical protein